MESRDRGGQWIYAGNGLPAVPIWRMKVRDDEGIMGTHGRGIWTVPVGDVVVSVDQDSFNELPAAFSLEQNDPNSFNPSTPFLSAYLKRHASGSPSLIRLDAVLPN